MAKEKPAMIYNEDTGEWERNEAYNAKIFLEAFERHVLLDAKITFKRVYPGGKLKARCEQLDTNLQFPRALRAMGKTYIADIIKAKRTDCSVYYRVYRNSIRDGKEVVG